MDVHSSPLKLHFIPSFHHNKFNTFRLICFSIFFILSDLFPFSTYICISLCVCICVCVCVCDLYGLYMLNYDLYVLKLHHRGVMVKALDCEFVLQSRYYVHFRANTLRKGMNSPSYGLNSTTTVLLGEWHWH